ncbi:MAG: hypothetical protein ACRD52_11090, partial [Candidatus Acidiferrales bacterium]
YTQGHRQNQTGSGLIHPIVKEQVIPGQLEGLQTNPNPTEAPQICQRFSAPQIRSKFTPCEFPVPLNPFFFFILQRLLHSRFFSRNQALR